MTRAIVIGRLKPWEQRTRKQQDIVAAINRDLAAIPGVRLFAINPPSLGALGRLGSAVEFVIRTSEPYAQLKQYSDRLIEAASRSPALANLDTDLVLNKPQIRFDIDRQRVADLGLSVETIGRTLESLIGGRQVTRFTMNGEQYDVVVQVAGGERASPEALRSIYVRNASGQIIQLSAVASTAEDDRATRTQPLQPAPVRDHHGEPRAGLFLRRGAGGAGGRGARGAAAYGAG